MSQRWPLTPFHHNDDNDDDDNDDDMPKPRKWNRTDCVNTAKACFHHQWQVMFPSPVTSRCVLTTWTTIHGVSQATNVRTVEICKPKYIVLTTQNNIKNVVLTSWTTGSSCTTRPCIARLTYISRLSL